jgi:hypothetical protein
MTAFFTQEMISTLRFSSICQNKDSEFIHTDQAERVCPILDSIISTLCELCNGPCVPNQRIVLSVPYLGFYPVYIRILDNIDSPFYHLKYDIINLMRSLCEGNNKNMLKRIAKNISAVILEEMIIHLMKKIFIREQMLMDETRKVKRFEKFARTAEKSGLSSGVGSHRLSKLAAMKIDQCQGSVLDLSNVLDPKNGIFDGDKPTGSTGSLDEKLDPNVITQKMESWLQIDTWEEIYDMYLRREGFTRCEIFITIFNT